MINHRPPLSWSGSFTHLAVLTEGACNKAHDERRKPPRKRDYTFTIASMPGRMRRAHRGLLLNHYGRSLAQYSSLLF